MLPNERDLQRLVEFAYQEGNPSNQLQAATDLCQMMHMIHDIEAEGALNSEKVTAIINQVHQPLIYMLRSVRSSTVRTYSARAFGFICKRQRVDADRQLPHFLLQIIKDQVTKYNERNVSADQRVKAASLCESCLWPLTECMKEPECRQILIKDFEDESLLRSLLWLIKIDHTGTKTNLFALLIRMLKADDDDGRVKHLLHRVNFGEDVHNMLVVQKDKSYGQGSQEPDWIRNLRTLDRLLNSEPPTNVLIQPPSPREPAPPVPFSHNDILYFRKKLLELGFQKIEDEQIQKALTHIAENESQVLSSKAEDVLSHVIDFFIMNPSKPEPTPPPVTPPNEFESWENEHLLFMGLESDPICFNRQLPESNIPAVLDFADEERRIVAGINKAKCQVGWCFDILTFEKFFEVVFKVHMLHVSGHGAKNKFIVEDGLGSTKIIEAEDLSRIRLDNEPLRIVFVSMCHSQGVAQKFVEMGVPHVIAVDNDLKVKDSLAVAFAGQFYAFLFGGQKLQAAFHRAKEFCAIQFQTDVPFLLLPEGANHDQNLVQIFGERFFSNNNQRPCEELIMGHKTPKNTIPPLDSHNIGRHWEVLKGFSYLYRQKQHDYKIMIIEGYKHVGKRTVCGILAHYVHRLKKADDGVLYVSFPNPVSSVHDFVVPIHRAIESLQQQCGGNHVVPQPNADAIFQYLVSTDMCLFLTCDHNCDHPTWLPDDKNVLSEIQNFLRRLVNTAHKPLKVVLCITKECHERISAVGEYWNLLPTVRIPLLDILQAKQLVRQRVPKFAQVRGGNYKKQAENICTSGIFKKQFKLPFTPRIIEKLCYLVCHEQVPVKFLIRVLKEPQKKWKKIADKKFPPKTGESIQRWKDQILEIQRCVQQEPDNNNEAG